MPSLSNSIDIEWTEARGRFAIANRPIPAGDHDDDDDEEDHNDDDDFDHNDDHDNDYRENHVDDDDLAHGNIFAGTLLLVENPLADLFLGK